MTEITPKQIGAVRRFLKDHPEYFTKANEAHSWFDFNRWPTTATDRNHLIMPGELFMVDLIGTETGTFWIARLGRKDSPRAIKRIAQLSINMRGDYGDVLNGYWAIPVEALHEA